MPLIADTRRRRHRPRSHRRGAARARCARSDLSYEEGLVGGAAYKATGIRCRPRRSNWPSAPTRSCSARSAIRRATRSSASFRPEQAILGLRKAARPVRQPAPGQDVPRARGRLRAAPRDRRARSTCSSSASSTATSISARRASAPCRRACRQGYDIMSYDEDEVRRIAHVGFEPRRAASGSCCSVDKANVLETCSCGATW